MYLTRNKKSRCVMARIRREGRPYHANFTLKEYGNWKSATEAASKWVNSLLKNLPPRAVATNVMTSRNRSGVVGVYRHRQRHRRPGGRVVFYHAWVARWPHCPYRGGVKWPVKRFGEDDAFVLAVLCPRLKSIDRSQLLENLAAARDTNEYREILRTRKKTPVRKKASRR
jgi:hypothetical protein